MDNRNNDAVTPPARLQAAIEILDAIIAAARDNGPAADTVLADWFKTRRYAGSKDRRAVRDLVYRAIRAFGAPPPSARAAFAAFDDLHPLFDGSGYGPPALGENEIAAQPSLLSPWLAGLIPAEEHAALLERAPFDLRVNALKTTRDTIAAELEGAQPIAGTAHGLRLPEPLNLAARPDLAGLVEPQDASSQIAAAVCAAKPGMTVIDLCAGAGGKALALAADMAVTGKLIACDTDRGRLSRLPRRAALAGAEGIETRLLNPGREQEALADLEAAADLVLVDAPCSGSGTWRRNPELRWRLTPARLDAVIALQRHVLALGSSLVRPGGVLVYAVCSLIAREGPQQVETFVAANQGWRCDETRSLTPSREGSDGFFVARLSKG